MQALCTKIMTPLTMEQLCHERQEMEHRRQSKEQRQSKAAL
jgi:hypothetical protein